MRKRFSIKFAMFTLEGGSVKDEDSVTIRHASTSVLRNPNDGRFSKVPFTSVLWNTKDYPFPKDLGLVTENIIKALSDKDGYCKNLFWIVSAYGDEINKMESEILFKARIFYKGYASVHEYEFQRVLRALKTRGVNVLSVEPQAHISSDTLFLSPELLSLSSKVIISTSSNQDFSEHITRIYGSKTAVFWDVAEVPLHVLLFRPDDIYEYIGFHLKAKGFDGEMSIWAYAEKIPFSDAALDTFRDIKLHFVPNVPGDKAARVLRMINDIELWKIDSLLVDLLKSPSVTVISNDIDGAISFNKCLRMKNGGYKALLIQPKDLPSATDTDDAAVDLVAALFRRPSSLFEVGKMIEFTCKPKLWRMKKHKVKEEEQYPKHLLQKLRSETYSFTGVFWLVEQIPNCCDSISRIINAAVKKMGYFDGVEIYAYGGEKSGSSQEEAKWWDSRIFYDPQGDKDIRVQRMLIEMIWFATNQANSYDDSKITKVMLIYKEALGDNVLRVLCALEARDFKVLLVRYDDEAELFRSENSMFESTRFLDGSRPTDWHSISPDDVFNCSNSSSWETDNGTDDDDDSDNSSDPQNLHSRANKQPRLM
ncbi:unnamed protein product [Cochlearia groenlandica]